jgi:hypothetical protein
MLHTANFKTRIQNDSSTTIDNIFVDNSRINLSAVYPTINGLLGQVVQILTNKNIYATINKFPLKQRTRIIDNKTIINFQTLLTPPPPHPKKTVNLFI